MKTTPRSLPQPNGDCPECRGSGKIGMYQERCNSCDGTGYIKDALIKCKGNLELQYGMQVFEDKYKSVE